MKLCPVCGVPLLCNECRSHGDVIHRLADRVAALEFENAARGREVTTCVDGSPIAPPLPVPSPEAKAANRELGEKLRGKVRKTSCMISVLVNGKSLPLPCGNCPECEPTWGFDRCRHCERPLYLRNVTAADGCPCNSERGVNHGLVPSYVCTCVECDPAQTGGSRAPKSIDELIAASSFGTPEAMAIRAQADPEQVEKIVERAEALRIEGDAIREKAGCGKLYTLNLNYVTCGNRGVLCPACAPKAGAREPGCGRAVECYRGNNLHCGDVHPYNQCRVLCSDYPNCKTVVPFEPSVRERWDALPTKDRAQVFDVLRSMAVGLEDGDFDPPSAYTIAREILSGGEK